MAIALTTLCGRKSAQCRSVKYSLGFFLAPSLMMIMNGETSDGGRQTRISATISAENVAPRFYVTFGFIKQSFLIR